MFHFNQLTFFDVNLLFNFDTNSKPAIFYKLALLELIWSAVARFKSIFLHAAISYLDLTVCAFHLKL